MNVRSVITEMKNDGYEVSVNGDKLHVESDQPLTNKQRQYLKQRKSEIIRYLLENALEAAEERSAIMEYDGGLPRKEAEIQAVQSHLKAIYFKTEDGEGTYLSKCETIEEAKENIKYLFGNKLLMIDDTSLH